MDPKRRPSITVVKGLHHEGYYPITLDGAIWGATISGNGRYGAVVTGAHSLYVFNLDGYPRVDPISSGGHRQFGVDQQRRLLCRERHVGCERRLVHDDSRTAALEISRGRRR